MTTRSVLATRVAFGVGVACGLLFAVYLGGIPPVSQALGGRQASAQAGVDLAGLRADVERLKEKATDQAHAMVSVAYHFNNLWFAGQHGNWPLAEFYLAETRSHLRWAVRVIPVRKNNAGQDVDLRPMLESLENSALHELAVSIKAGDRERFAGAYKFMLEGCRSCHATSDKPFIRTRIPTHPADPMVDFEPLAASGETPQEEEAPRGAASDGEEKGERTQKGEHEGRKASAMLIEPAELEKRLGGPRLRLLDTRSRDDYTAAHITGAV